MRNTLWIIPVLLLSAAIGAPNAHADTIVISGGHVTGINGITIAGTTYNVTWGTTIDNTFASSPTNATLMNNAIAADLNGFGAITVADASSNSLNTIGVFAGAGVGTYGAFNLTIPPLWSTGIFPTPGYYATLVSNNPTSTAWDEFAVVATPEPSTAPLTLAGLGVIAVLVWKRRQDALRY